jgi:hypothetical protein
MDPTSWAAKLDQAVKPLVIVVAAFSVCVGFFINRITSQDFMPFVYLVVGAAFGRGMMAMGGFTKTTETDGQGGKKETTVTAPLAPAHPPVPPGALITGVTQS